MCTGVQDVKISLFVFRFVGALSRSKSRFGVVQVYTNVEACNWS